MKLIFSVLLIFALVLSSCTQVAKPSVGINFTTTAGNEAELDEYLVYLTHNYPGPERLRLYDPVNQIHSALLPNWDIDDFSISAKNRLAFSVGSDEKKDIYLLDYPFIKSDPIKITQVSVPELYLLPWSQDGCFLAYETVEEDGHTLFVWDGATATPIYHQPGYIGGVAWSMDGRLAFYGEDDEQYEIFVWDGETVVNASQDPSGDDMFPAWSADGQLAFLSCPDKTCDILIWDGKSMTNSVPDRTTFTNAAPALTDYYSHPVWTSSGSLSFIAFGPEDRHAQVYEWDGQTATNISQNPDYHNAGQRWRSDGYWAFVTFFSPARILYVRDAKNQTVLTTEAEAGLAWSQGGNLMFCLYERPEWVLFVWDGTSVKEVVRGDEIEAQWNNGEGVFCSSG